MRIRIRTGELRIYLGEAGYKKMSKDKIVAAIMEAGDDYIAHARKYGFWVCINSINTKRYKINPEDII